MPTLLLLAILIAAHARASEDPTRVRITEAARGPGNILTLRHTAVPGYYYILLRGEEVTGMFQPVVMDVATGESGELIDANALYGQAFYRIQQVPVSQPSDADFDGIDDLFEMAHRSFLNPLDRRDAEADFDSDGRSNLQEYLGGTDPAQATAPPPPMPTLNPVASPTSQPSIFLTGSARPNSALRVEGGAAVATGTTGANGQFQVAISLRQNAISRLSVVAVDSQGQPSPPATTDVLHDAQPPTIIVDYPPEGAEVIVDSTVVLGRVGDALSGFNGLTVTVSNLTQNVGGPANVAVGLGPNGTFERGGVPLAEGTNILLLTARDSLGNSVTRQITVRRIVPSGARLVSISGDMQGASIQQRVADPLVVKILRADGSPFTNKLVTFEVTRSDGRLLPVNTNALATDFSTRPEANANGATLLQLFTDNQGEAAVQWTLGSDSGCANNRVTVSSRDIAGPVLFCASASPGPPLKVNIGTGNNQRAEAGGSAAEPLRVWVNDTCNGIAGMPVTFRVIQGGGKVNGQDSVTIPTSASGHAQVDFILGTNAGNNRVEATFPNNPTAPAVFVVSGVKRDLDRPTTFTGIVLDNANQPIVGAACRLEIGTFSSETIMSDPNGQFRFSKLPSGTAHLFVDGRTALFVGTNSIPSNSFPALMFMASIVPNTENSLPLPVLLPRLNPNNARVYHGTNDIVLTVEGIAGLKMTIKANSMRHPDGRPVTPEDPATVSLNQVHHDDMPMVLADGASPPFAWSLQPGGALFDPPVQIEYPNMSGLPAGAIAFFLSFSHELERFEVVGSGHVDETGAKIVTDPGSGLTHAGWGASCPPYPAIGDCGNDVVSVSGPPVLKIADELTLNASEPPVTWSVESLGGEVLIVEQDPSSITIKGEEVGLVRVKATGVNSNGERQVRVMACQLSKSPPQLPPAASGGGWAIGAVEVSDSDGLVIRDITLQNRFMARKMSIPYLTIDLNTPGGPQTIRAELRPDSSDAIARCRLVSAASSSGGSHVLLRATYVIDRLPDDTSTASLCIDQTYLFLAFDEFSDCNAAEVACARFYPTVSYHFSPGSAGEISVVNVSIPQRFEFETDGVALNRCGFSGDAPQPADPNTPPHCQTGGAVWPITFFPSGLNPSPYEAFARPVRQGALNSPPLVDNYHQTSLQCISTPIPGPGSFAVHDQGCPECVHIHWRWAVEAEQLDFDFFANGGQPMIPPGSPQTIRVGHTKFQSGDEDPEDWRTLMNVENYNAVSTGAKVVFWYEGSSPAEADAFFQHGGFYLPPSELAPSPSPQRLEAAKQAALTVPRSPLLALAPPSVPILDDSWFLTVGGQTVRPDADGGFSIPNIAAPDAFGGNGAGSPPDGISDHLMRVVGVSTRSGVNRYLTSEFFEVRTGTNVTLTNIQFHITPPLSPESISASADRVTFNAIGQQAQLTVTAHYADGTQSNLTARAKGTTYRTSNPRIAAVDTAGLVTAVGRGTVFVTAINEGATTVLQMDVVPGDPLTTVIGFVHDADGLPVAGAEVSLTGLAAQAITGPDGRFAITDVPTTVPALSVIARYMDNGERLLAIVSGISLVPGGITDSGLLIVRPPAVRSSPPRIATSFNSSWVIKDDGSLWAWGLNLGRLGDGTQVGERVSPIRIGQDTNWLAVSAESEHTLALRQDGTLWAWGDNDDGQLGNGGGGRQNAPIRVGLDSDWVAIAAGDDYSLALKADGSLWGWGRNDEGQLGDGTGVDHNIPTRIGTDFDWMTIATRNEGTAALKSDGALFAWGNHSRLPASVVPVRIGTDDDWAAVALGSRHLVLLKIDGTLWGMGELTFVESTGQPVVFGSVPAKLGTDSDWTSVAAGRLITFAIKQNGSLWAFGDNEFGKLGDGTLAVQTSFVPIGAGQTWLAVSGHDHAVALTATGQFYAWGDNDAGQLGLGYKGYTQATPLQAGTDSDWTFCAFGNVFALGVKADRTIWTWGLNFNGELGDGTTLNRSAPVRVGSDSNWVFAAAGQSHSLAIKQDGSLWGWGQNFFGQLARDPVLNSTLITPTQIGSDSNWVSVAAGEEHSFGIKADGSLWAWGGNSSGQLGDGTIETRLVPTRIGSDTDWKTVAASALNPFPGSFALKTSGTLWAWGENQFFQSVGSDFLGIGGTSDQLTPVLVGTNSNWRAVATQPFPGNFRFVINTNGELWTWAGFPDFGTFFSPVSTTIDFIAFDEFGNQLFSAQLTPSEIIDSNSLVPRLTNHTDLLSEFLWNQMPFHQDLLIDTNVPPDQKVAVLADGLNVSLQGPSIYEEQRFAGITLSAEVQTLIQSNPQGQDLIRLNRLLLEAAYPAEIARLSNRPWRQISAGREHWIGIRNDGSLWGEGLGLVRGRIETASDWIHAAAGSGVSAAIKADGTLWTWGDYSNGVLGNRAIFMPRPVIIPAD